MKPNTRFVASVIDTASKTDIALPWHRGARRTAFIAKRSAPVSDVKKSA